MNFFVKLLVIPFAAFFAMMLTVAIMGSFYGPNELKEILGGTNALPVWYIWICILSVITLVQHFLNRKNQ